MRRTEIIKSVEELQRALTETNIPKALRSLLESGAGRSQEREMTGEILNVFKEYAVRAHSFSPAATRVAEILELQNLSDAKQWIQFSENPPELFAASQRVSFALEVLPKMAALFQQESVQQTQQSIDNQTGRYKGMRTLTVTVFENGDRFSSPTRLANVLESFNLFYSSCAMMSGESPDTLSVIACDSGSDKSFDFLGLAKVMECVERIINSIWDRVVFYREHQFEERVELISNSLPVISQIQKMQEENQIEPELAEKLRRNILEGAAKFIQSGASIPKIDSNSRLDVRQLLSPVQKLLVGSTDENSNNEQPRNAEASSLNVDNLSEDELRQLRELLGKSKKASTADVQNLDVDAMNHQS